MNSPRIVIVLLAALAGAAFSQTAGKGDSRPAATATASGPTTRLVYLGIERDSKWIDAQYAKCKADLVSVEGKVYSTAQAKALKTKNGPGWEIGYRIAPKVGEVRFAPADAKVADKVSDSEVIVTRPAQKATYKPAGSGMMTTDKPALPEVQFVLSGFDSKTPQFNGPLVYLGERDLGQAKFPHYAIGRPASRDEFVTALQNGLTLP